MIHRAEPALFSLDLSSSIPVNGLLADNHFHNESIFAQTVPTTRDGGFWIE